MASDDAAPAVEVVEYTDPGCSWAWGTEPKLRLLRWRHGERLRWRRVMGGLVGDMDAYVDGGFDPVRGAKSYSGYWKTVADETGMPYPARLEWMYRSTEPAGRAVKAAELQGADVADRVLRRLREQIFVFGRPPDTDERILEAVSGLPGLDEQALVRDLDSTEVEKAFRENWEETRQPNDYVRGLEPGPPGGARLSEGHWRYVFPTLIFRGPEGERTVPGWKPYEDYEDAMETVAPGSTDGAPDRPSPREMFDTWGTAAPKELEVICGNKVGPPDDAIPYDWGDGVFYLSREEAAARGLA